VAEHPSPTLGPGEHDEAGGTPGQPVARWAYRTAVSCYLALIALLLLWILWLAPPPVQLIERELPPGSLISPVLLLVVGPLLLPLRGILHRRRYTLAWSTMLILAYFVHGVAYTVGGGVAGWLGMAEVTLVLGYFAATNAYMRLTRAPRTPRE